MLGKEPLNTRTNTDLYRLTFNLWHLREGRGDRAAAAYSAVDHQCSSCVVLSAGMNAPSYLFSAEGIGGV